MPILYIRNANGEFVEVPAIRGKSAYEYAKDGGYTGTEEEFAEKLAFLMGYSVFGYVDENKHVVLKGDISDGSILKFDMEDGTTIVIAEAQFYCQVENNLTNCTNSNAATETAKGKGYTATITANSGYELKSVTVTMGGSPVTVNGGTITIEEVTGDIVITAVAEETAEPTNFFVVGGDGYINPGRCSSTGADRTDTTSCFVTNYIDVSYGDTVYIKSYQTPTAENAYSGIKYTDGTTGGFMLETDTTIVKDFSLANGIAQFTINAENADYMRFTILKHSSLDDIIINVKRNGEWL